jgi:hypothetical protein
MVKNEISYPIWHSGRYRGLRDERRITIPPLPSVGIYVSISIHWLEVNQISYTKDNS